MPEEYLLSIDVGTTSIKVGLFTIGGKLKAMSTQEYSLLTPSYVHPDMFFLPNVPGKPRGGAIESIWHFVEAISQNKELAVSGKDGLEATKVVVAIEESVKRRLPVEID